MDQIKARFQQVRYPDDDFDNEIKHGKGATIARGKKKHELS